MDQWTYVCIIGVHEVFAISAHLNIVLRSIDTLGWEGIERQDGDKGLREFGHMVVHHQ